MMKHKPTKKYATHLSTWQKVAIATGGFVLLVGGICFLWAATIKLPDISTFEARKIANSSKITDRNGVVLYDINQGVRRTEIPFEEMGDNIKHAVVAIEDAHFYTHKGIRPTSIIRAIYVNITSGSFSQGGSTLTQQIIKNTLLNTDKTIVRKFKEWVLALKLEREFTKDQILTIYLNDAPFGSTIYGVEEAAKAFYTIPAKEMSIAQSAYLAALMPAPSYYSPFGKHKDKLDERKNLVISKMEDEGYITAEQAVTAKNETVVFNVSASNSVKAPHFVFWILDQLEERYGKDVMESGGFTITTTLDYELQQQAEAAITKHAENNKTRYNASNSSMVVIDPTTGHILAMVGSKDYFNKEIDGAFNVAVAQRQPGSSFKPFAYLTAFAKGYTPETILFDVPTEFSTNCAPITVSTPASEGCYHPQNFDGKFKGPISMRSALAESRNIPSVKTLYLAGLDDVVETAHKLGITTLRDPKQIGLSLVLGGGEVSLLDMTSAYGVFANSGTRNPSVGILTVTDQKGKVMEEFTPDAREVFDTQAILTLNDVLSDPIARTPTFGGAITIPGVAVKTGTTNDERDAWIMGYTPTIAVGVWSGNNNNTSMRSGGSAVSGPILKSFMEEYLKEHPAPAFEKPAIDPDRDTLKPILRGEWMGNHVVEIDSVTGLRATDATPRGSIIERVITDVQDILYWVNKNDPRGPAPNNPASDPQFRLWNPPVQVWWMQNMARYNITSEQTLPTQYEDIHAQDTGSISIQGLPSTMKRDNTATITINPEGQYPLTSAELFIDNNLVATLSSPFRFRFTPADTNLSIGTHTVKAIGTNSIHSKKTTEKQITITE
jgi:1A family penicillin-binding protein